MKYWGVVILFSIAAAFILGILCGVSLSDKGEQLKQENHIYSPEESR